MKRSRLLVIVLAAIMMFLMVAPAYAIGISGSYSNGKVKFHVSDFHDYYTVKVGGASYSGSGSSGSISVQLSAGSHTMSVVDTDGCKASCSVSGEPAPTEEPTVAPTQEPTVAPTEEPTVAPTQEPTVKPTQEPTVKPTQEPTAKPTAEPSDDDVPKTGDNTMTYAVIAMVLLAGAVAVMVIRKLCRNH